MLTAATAKPGDFLVRNSESDPGAYTLSVRMHEQSGATGVPVKHFRVKQTPTTGRWSLALKTPTQDTFESVPALISYYQNKGEFSGVRLVQPAADPNAKPAKVSLLLVLVCLFVCCCCNTEVFLRC